MNVKIDFGETRHIQIEVISTKNENFSISAEATYDLVNLLDAVSEDSGAANVLGHVIDVVVSPKKRGDYDLKYVYKIADEILIDIVKLVVT